MKINCTCDTKHEQWEFEFQLRCWYVVRECDHCSYYWEGPDYSKTLEVSILDYGDKLQAVITVVAKSVDYHYTVGMA